MISMTNLINTYVPDDIKQRKTLLELVESVELVGKSMQGSLKNPNTNYRSEGVEVYYSLDGERDNTLQDTVAINLYQQVDMYTVYLINGVITKDLYIKKLKTLFTRTHEI